MKRYLKSISLLTGLALFASCDKNFLDTQPTDRITDDIFWEKETDAEHAVNAIYNRIPGIYYLWLEATTDNAFAGRTTSPAYAFGNGTQTSTTPWAEDYWQRCYQGIQRANYLLANIDKVPTLSDDLRSQFIGEAKFLRAFFYNDLVNLYGDVPLIISTVNITNSGAPRDSKQVVLEFIVSELNSIIDSLPVSYDSDNVGRVTRGAVLAFLSRIYLQQHDFKMAKETASSVMDLDVYALYHDYAELFTYEAENNPEIIFDQQFIPDNFNHNVSRLLSPRSTAGESQIVPIKSLVDAYEAIDGLKIDKSTMYNPMSPYENRDPRLQATILTPGATWGGTTFRTAPGSGSTDEIAANVNTSLSGLNFKKYINVEDREQNNNNGSINIIMIRYAEVLLTYAESKIELNEIDDSVYKVLNEVRRRADMPEIEKGKSQLELREIVRRERRIELAGEGIRLFDIKRWDIMREVMNGRAEGIVYIEDGEAKTIFVENRSFQQTRDILWPIPQRELIVNRSLHQNPGY